MMQTYSGRSVWPTGHAPTPEEEGGWPSDTDIGVALGRIPRFAGHTRDIQPYPVLAHLFVVTNLVPDGAKAYALLHDSPESCCNDVPTPWKTEAAELRENDLLERLTIAWGLVWPWPEWVAAEVKRADFEAQCAEVRVLDHVNPSLWPFPTDESLAETREIRGFTSKMTIPSYSSVAMIEAAEKWRPLGEGYDASRDLTLLDEYVPVDISHVPQDDHSEARWNPRHVRGRVS